MQLPSMRNEGLAYNIKTLFAAGEEGIWYDPSDMSTMYQDYLGNTKVTAYEQPVGLILDKSGRGHNCSQPTSANRPILSARVNLITGSEDISNSAWVTTNASKTGFNTIYDPNILLTADTIQLISANNTSAVYQDTSGNTATNYTIKAWVKRNSSSNQQFQLWLNIGGGANNFYSGSLSATATWQLFTFSATGLVGRLMCGFCGNVAGVTSDIAVWGVDVRPTDQFNNILPNYQKVNTSTDYDINGFPPYLKFNGTSSCMVTTGNVNFNNSLVTMFTGLRKTSDSVSVFLELGTNTAGIPGSLLFCAPSYLTNLTAVGKYAAAVYGTSLYNVTEIIGFNSPITNLLTVTFNNVSSASTSNTYRVNKNNVSLNANFGNAPGGGNFVSNPLYLGARAGSTYFFSGNMYSLVVRAGDSSSKNTTIERIMNSKTKAL